MWVNQSYMQSISPTEQGLCGNLGLAPIPRRKARHAMRGAAAPDRPPPTPGLQWPGRVGRPRSRPQYEGRRAPDAIRAARRLYTPCHDRAREIHHMAAIHITRHGHRYTDRHGGASSRRSADWARASSRPARARSRAPPVLSAARSTGSSIHGRAIRRWSARTRIARRGPACASSIFQSAIRAGPRICSLPRSGVQPVDAELRPARPAGHADLFRPADRRRAPEAGTFCRGPAKDRGARQSAAIAASPAGTE